MRDQMPPARAFPFPFPDHRGPEPAPEYSGLPDASPLVPVVLRNGAAALLVHRHHDVRAVLTDRRFSRAAAADLGLTSRSKESLALNAVDPPLHTRRRRLVAHAFTQARAAKLRPETARITDELLTAMIGHGGTADLMAEFALPLTIAVVCRILGLPVEQQALFRPWTEAMMSTTAYPRAHVAAAHQAMHEYFAGLLAAASGAVAPTAVSTAAPAAAPTAGLMAELAQRCDRGELTAAEAAHLASGLLMAGYETTSNQLGVCALVLLLDPVLSARLRTEPAALPAAIEEMLRWTSLNATGGVPHVALADTSIGGTVIRAGQVVVPVTDGANRDPAVFEQPDRLDIDRQPNPHASFGHGRHMCLGAAVARMELEVALGALLSRPPVLAGPADELSWRTGMYVRGLRALPVRW
jgi:cytochrome P450